MSLRDKIETDYKNALKSKDKNKISTYRLILSGIKDLDINNESSGKPSDTYIEVILSSGKKLSYPSGEQKKLIKDLENTKL